MGYRKFLAFITLALFLLIAALPLYGMLIPGLHGDTGENRVLAAWPSEPDPAAIEEWFDDHFALRGRMTQLYNMYNAKSGVEVINGVAIGNDGWLYYMYDNSDIDIKRESHYTQAELDHICYAQQNVADYLESKGISYYLMVCPDKHTVYPEFLPSGLQGYEGESRFDGLSRALTENTTVNLIDARQTIIDHKDEGRLFFKTDTHWNAEGSFLGYTQLMERIAQDHPNVRIITEAEVTAEVDTQWKGGDMSGFIGQGDILTDTLVNYSVIGSTLVLNPSPYPETSDDPERPILCYENPDHPELPTAVIFRDSFMGKDSTCRLMLPLLADSFSKVTIVWSTSVLNHIVEGENPDIVIMEYVERYSGSAGNGMDVPIVMVDSLVDYVTGETPLPRETFSIISCVDSMEYNGDVCSITGWAFDPRGVCVKGALHVGLKCGDEVIWCDTLSVDRPDVTAAYADTTDNADLDGSGFTAAFDKSALHAGKWEVIIAIDDGENEPLFGELGKRVKIQ